MEMDEEKKESTLTTHWPPELIFEKMKQMLEMKIMTKLNKHKTGLPNSVTISGIICQARGQGVVGE